MAKNQLHTKIDALNTDIENKNNELIKTNTELEENKKKIDEFNSKINKTSSDNQLIMQNLDKIKEFVTNTITSLNQLLMLDNSSNKPNSNNFED